MPKAGRTERLCILAVGGIALLLCLGGLLLVRSRLRWVQHRAAAEYEAAVAAQLADVGDLPMGGDGRVVVTEEEINRSIMLPGQRYVNVGKLTSGCNSFRARGDTEVVSDALNDSRPSWRGT